MFNTFPTSSANTAWQIQMTVIIECSLLRSALLIFFSTPLPTDRDDTRAQSPSCRRTMGSDFQQRPLVVQSTKNHSRPLQWKSLITKCDSPVPVLIYGDRHLEISSAQGEGRCTGFPFCFTQFQNSFLLFCGSERVWRRPSIFMQSSHH
ncbi:hypothetical protein AVEN_145304-1 [Araneus ventricosus]|uniref:Uncharacterized protein n=1 Tax=Araneus ventricosus TaxID=182803 RepID=A0A4Y2LH87_ARAVE|nr:hypothetical protein AVEN_145304-1 [Araneus ventricosus]